jgi:hypothetical protein
MLQAPKPEIIPEKSYIEKKKKVKKEPKKPPSIFA